MGHGAQPSAAAAAAVAQPAPAGEDDEPGSLQKPPVPQSEAMCMHVAAELRGAQEEASGSV